MLARVAATIESRQGADPAASYVAALFAKGDDAILKKIGEEATETVMAAKDGDPIAHRRRSRRPVVPLPGPARAARPVRPADVLAELRAARRHVRATREKAARGR